MLSAYIYEEENLFNAGGKNCTESFISKRIVAICFVITVITDNDTSSEVNLHIGIVWS